MSKLVIFRGDAVETEMHLGGGTIRIGRDERNTIVLNDKSVSRFHAEVRAEGASYYVVDLKSRNGIFVNGHQIKGKAALSLGVPVTLGAYELALEDDLSTSELAGEPSHAAGHTVVSTAAADRAGRSSQSATQRMAAAQAAAPSAALFKRPAVFWSALGVATLLVCVVTYFVVRSIVGRREPVVETPPVAQVSIPAAETPPVDPNKEKIDQSLANARAALERREYDLVLSEVASVLELDAANPEALDLKRQAEEGKLPISNTTTTVKPPPPPTVTPVPDIPVRTGETQADYDARVLRVKTNYPEGMRSIERQDFLNGLSKFEAVKRDQPGYQQIDTLITEAHDKQRKAVDDALAQGQKSEQEGKLAEAKRWYERARGYDPNSPGARDRLAGLQDRTTKAGMEAFVDAGVYRKRSMNAKALELYKVAADLLPNGPERTEAQQWLEKLKP